MTECILIEIAQRFRKMEDATEETDLHLIARQERLGERIDSLEAKHASGKITYDAWCRESAGPQKELDSIIEQRGNIEVCLDACRDDMVAMQEFIRKHL